MLIFCLLFNGIQARRVNDVSYVTVNPWTPQPATMCAQLASWREPSEQPMQLVENILGVGIFCDFDR